VSRIGRKTFEKEAEEFDRCKIPYVLGATVALGEDGRVEKSFVDCLWDLLDACGINGSTLRFISVWTRSAPQPPLICSQAEHRHFRISKSQLMGGIAPPCGSRPFYTESNEQAPGAAA
jgi:hypothetical protein